MRTVIVPTVDRVGSAYHVSVRVLSADSGVAIISERAIARGADALIPTIDLVVMEVRRRIGEAPGAVAASRPLTWVATPSFDAYRSFRQASQLHDQRENHAAVPLYLEALALDPDFAAAWLGLGVALFNSVSGDSATYAWEEALARPERLTRAQRLNVTGMLAFVRGDLEASVDAYRALHRIAGRPVQANNLAVVLDDLDRTAEGVDLVLAQERGSPFGLNPLARGNLALWLAALGRFAEARGRVEGLTADMRARVVIQQGSWAEAESLATSVLDTLSGLPGRTALLAGILGSTAAASGRVQDAFGHLRQRRLHLSSLRNWRRIRSVGYDLLALSLASGVPLSAEDARPLAWDSTIGGRAAAAFLTAVLGDTTGAAAMLRLPTDSGRASSATRLGEGDRALIHAAIASARSDAAGIVHALAPLGRQVEIRLNPGSHVAYWMLGDAYDKLGQGDSAAIWFGALIDITRIASEDRYSFGLTHSFAHFRLARIHAARGDRASSRMHASTFLNAFRKPDPEFMWMVAEAQRLVGEN
jgi:tetratricopeptide (TPR) repeat protein